jgi:hypothetical protein
MSTARPQLTAMRQRLGGLRARPMARRPGEGGRFRLSPREMRIAGWVAALVLVLAIAGFVRLLGGDAGPGAPGDGNSPSPSPSILPIAFGTSLDAERQVVPDSETGRFARGDTVAYSVAGTEPVASIYVGVERRLGGPAEQVQAPVDAQPLPNGASLIGFTVPAAVLLDAWGPGTYVMRIHLEPDGPPIAEGRFELIEPLPSASSGG